MGTLWRTREVMAMSSLFTSTQVEADSGYRLARLEVFNWGTFDKQIWKIQPNGDTFLLTGANGSGKSTLVDCILTLLVPSHKRNYNLAAGTDNRKKDRSEKTYVEGHYGKADGSTLKVRPRPDDCFSVLLGVFVQKERKEFVSIAQVFWSENGEIRKFFVLGDLNLSIEQNFQQNSSIKDLRSNLKKAGITLYDNFKAYSAEFRQRVGLRSEKGIDLFNQIVAIKSLGQLNDFVREHMLEGKDRRNKIEELDRNFSNLTETYEEISKAREQVKLLDPMLAKGNDLGVKLADLEHVAGTMRNVPFYFFDRKKTILAMEEARIQRDEEIEREKHRNIFEELGKLQEEKIRLQTALENNDTQKRISDLNNKKKALEEELRRREKKRNSYQDLAKKIGFAVGGTEEDFLGHYEKANIQLEEGQAKKAIVREELIQKSGEKLEKEKQLRTILVELEYLKANQNLIPEAQARIRSEICTSLGIPETDLWYSCELLQVKESEKEWRGAIERLLRNFGLRLMVPEKYYQALTNYVNQTDLGSRLVYSRMVELGTNLSPKTKNDVFYKLEMKPGLDSFTREWLESQILKEFDYVCTDLSGLREEERAITREGLVKSGKIRHEKDDRRSIHDSRSFILGWNNREKMKALEQEYAEIGGLVYELSDRIKDLKKSEETLEKEGNLLHRFLDYKVFAEIDALGIGPDLQEIEDQLEKLEKDSQEYLELKNQVLVIENRITLKTEEERASLKKVNNYEFRREQIRKELEGLKNLLFEIPEDELDRYRPFVEAFLTGPPEELSELASMERQITDQLEAKRKKLTVEKEKLQEDIVRRMTRFLQTYPEDCTREELSSDPNALPEFVRYFEKLKQERLPEFESRFRAMMDEKVSTQIIEFQASLEDDVDEIQERIDELNESLKLIDYQKDKTYIQLRYFPTKQKEIIGEEGFKGMLRNCIPDLGNPESNEKKFDVIRELLSRLKAENGSDRWSRLVTDARNWLDFQVQEIHKDSHEIREVYDSSAGKSGGQTVKLAYTILASAIYYQFGLRNKRSFRFVVIDEMFNNLDNQNASFAMDLFRKLGLQLMVVTPMDKINVVEPYIQSVHFVRINSEGNCSKVYSITREEIQDLARTAVPTELTADSP